MAIRVPSPFKILLASHGVNSNITNWGVVLHPVWFHPLSCFFSGELFVNSHQILLDGVFAVLDLDRLPPLPAPCLVTSCHRPQLSTSFPTSHHTPRSLPQPPASALPSQAPKCKCAQVLLFRPGCVTTASHLPSGFPHSNHTVPTQSPYRAHPEANLQQYRSIGGNCPTVRQS